MPSRAVRTRSRKRPEERREEILCAAAEIALDEGLERITLRAVADRLGVQPGLITHYFPAAEDLVVAAFARAACTERELFFPAGGDVVSRLAGFIAHLASGASLPLARMWLNARHLSRFSPALADALVEQDQLDRDRLVALLQAGVASGQWPDADVQAASTRILLAVDGHGSYANSAAKFTEPAHDHFVSDVAEWTLGLEQGALRRAG